MEEDLRKCPYCAEDIKSGAILCKHCGSSITSPGVQPQAASTSYVASANVPAEEREKSGLAISSLILGVIALVIALVDIGFVTSGDYAYITDEEVGFIAILALTSLGLGIGALRKSQRYGKAALSVSIAAIVMMFAAASLTI